MISKSDESYSKQLLLCLGAIFLIRLVSLWFNNSELFFDEAQYWFWAQELEFGYFSKPPLLAWLIDTTTNLCGSETPFCVRLSSPILHIATAVMIFLTAKHLFDPRTAFWASLIYATLPAVSLSSTIVSTDVPLLFCWSIALYAYVCLRQERNVFLILLLGLAIGFGLNAKYAMIYFIGCAILHAFVERHDYVPARKWEFWIAVGLGAAMLVPNILWNVEHGFVTVSHTGENIGWAGLTFNWSGFAEFFGSQFGVFGPILFGIFIATVVRMLKDSLSPQHRLLVVFSVPILAIILFQALMSKAYANWAATTYVAASILVAEIMVNRISLGWLRTSMGIHAVVFLSLALAVCFAAPGQLVLPGNLEPFKRTQGATLIAGEAEKLLDAYEYNGLITTDRKLSALMQYNLRDREESIHAWRAGDVPTDHFQLKVPFQESIRDPVLVMSRTDNMAAFSAGFTKAISLGHREIPAGEIGRIYFFRFEGHEKFQ
ncbi:MAG: glycosyltransferase family 39 protein [Pseudomonadota bacterium]